MIEENNKCTGTWKLSSLIVYVIGLAVM